MPGEVLLVRADAGAEIGTGHIMRCLALAQAWQAKGGRVIFAVAAGVELESRIRAEGVEVEIIPAQPGTDDDEARTVELCARSKTAWLVLDSYHFSAEYCRNLRSAVPRMLLIDDGEKRRACECDVVLNPDPDASSKAYPRQQGNAQFLLGPEYALLRREFLQVRVDRVEIAAKAKRVLVTLGGGDAQNVTLAVVQALDELNDLELELTVVTGASYRYRSSLEESVTVSAHATTLLSNIEDMPALMAGADLAITAGCGTCYELAFMKVPMFVITTAKNQEPMVAALSSAGAAVDGGWCVSLERSALAASLRRVICDRELRRNLVDNAGRLVDGRGAERVIQTMHAMCRGGSKVVV